MIPSGLSPELFSFVSPKFLVRISLAYFAWRNSSQRVWATKPRNDPKGIVNEDLVRFPKFSSQIQWATIPSLVVSFTWLHPWCKKFKSNLLFYLEKRFDLHISWLLGKIFSPSNLRIVCTTRLFLFHNMFSIWYLMRI